VTNISLKLLHCTSPVTFGSISYNTQEAHERDCDTSATKLSLIDDSHFLLNTECAYNSLLELCLSCPT